MAWVVLPLGPDSIQFPRCGPRAGAGVARSTARDRLVARGNIQYYNSIIEVTQCAAFTIIAETMGEPV